MEEMIRHVNNPRNILLDLDDWSIIITKTIRKKVVKLYNIPLKFMN